MARAETALELTVAAPNRPGELAKILKSLADKGVNLRAYTAYVDGEFGYLKAVASDVDAAKDALSAAGYHFTEKAVLLVTTDDTVGAAASVAAAIAGAGLSVGHSHGSSAGGAQALLVFNTNDNEAALKAING
ncbi:MAG: hypothetical protein KatS3mg024_0696 [Armatimonadota bacterium]|nr:MAG: hypothetical protein KatS3mg024_0696 [Armatimonadota bacterium]